jgi:hypothetical protein
MRAHATKHEFRSGLRTHKRPHTYIDTIKLDSSGSFHSERLQQVRQTWPVRRRRQQALELAESIQARGGPLPRPLSLFIAL